MQSLFDFREGVTKRVAKPNNRKVEAATELEDAKEAELAAKALLAHNKAQILCEKQRALPLITCFVATRQTTHCLRLKSACAKQLQRVAPSHSESVTQAPSCCCAMGLRWGVLCRAGATASGAAKGGEWAATPPAAICPPTPEPAADFSQPPMPLPPLPYLSQLPQICTPCLC